MRALLGALMLAVARGVATDFYVSPSGSDSNPGTISQPWKTISHAQSYIRSWRPKGGLEGPVTVHVGAGMYELSSPLEFTAQDSGEMGKEITYAGDAGAIVMAGSVVYPKVGSDGFATFQVPGGAPPSGATLVRSLFGAKDLERRPLASTPTLEYKSFNGSMLVVDWSTLNVSSAAELVDADAYVYAHWTSDTSAVSSVDATTGQITLAHPINSDWTKSAGNRYFLTNVASSAALTPNTFSYSRSTHEIRYHPRSGEDPSQTGLLVPQMSEALRLVGNATSGALVTDLVFKGLTIVGASGPMGPCEAKDACSAQSAADTETASVHMWGAERVVMDNVTIRGTGSGYGLWVDSGSRDVTISNSFLFDLGSGGIRAGVNAGDIIQDPEAVTRISVTDNTIYDTGHVIEAGCGVLFQQLNDSTLSHNEIFQTRYSAISLGWSWTYATLQSATNNTVAFNKLHDVFTGSSGVSSLEDGGCIYHLGISSTHGNFETGTKIVNNLCYAVDAWGGEGSYGSWGLYLDQASSYVTLEKNIVWQTKDGSHIHYGNENLWKNNIFADSGAYDCSSSGCQPALFRSSRHSSGEGATSSSNLQSNIFLLTQNKSELFYSTISDAFANFTLDYNLYWSQAATPTPSQLTFPPSQSPTTFPQWQAQGKDVHSMIADPMFDSLFPTFQLAQNSPAFKLGFEQIDTSQYGPRG